MAVTPAQAERTRQTAARDLKASGARVTITFEGEGRVDPITGVADPVGDRTVRTWALLTSYRLDLIDGVNVQQGDQRVMVADSELKPLASGFEGVGEGASTEGYWVYLGGDPSRHPEPGGPGVRKLAVVALEQTVYEGGWPVLRFLRARG